MRLIVMNDDVCCWPKTVMVAVADFAQIAPSIWRESSDEDSASLANSRAIDGFKFASLFVALLKPYLRAMASCIVSWQVVRFTVDSSKQ
jgi:hypothetical protein